MQVYIRNFGLYHLQLFDDMLADLQPLQPSDVIMLNFGAWYACWVAAQPQHNSVCMAPGHNELYQAVSGSITTLAAHLQALLLSVVFKRFAQLA